jgi:hypothetical protein
MDELKSKKVPPSEVVIAGPIEEYGKIYVYSFSVQE